MTYHTLGVGAAWRRLRVWWTRPARHHQVIGVCREPCCWPRDRGSWEP